MLLLYLNLIDDEQQRIEFEEIYTTYRKQMILLAKSLLHNDTDAEDVVHDVFLRIASKHIGFIQGLRHPEDVRNYLLKATKNTALNELSRKGRSTVSLDTLSESDLTDTRDLSDAAFIELLCTKAKSRTGFAFLARTLQGYYVLPLCFGAYYSGSRQTLRQKYGYGQTAACTWKEAIVK